MKNSEEKQNLTPTERKMKNHKDCSSISLLSHGDSRRYTFRHLWSTRQVSSLTYSKGEYGIEGKTQREKDV
jgi:hypothetical protein